jgi:hypothetical protein
MGFFILLGYKIFIILLLMKIKIVNFYQEVKLVKYHINTIQKEVPPFVVFS